MTYLETVNCAQVACWCLEKHNLAKDSSFYVKCGLHLLVQCGLEQSFLQLYCNLTYDNLQIDGPWCAHLPPRLLSLLKSNKLGPTFWASSKDVTPMMLDIPKSILSINFCAISERNPGTDSPTPMLHPKKGTPSCCILSSSSELTTCGLYFWGLHFPSQMLSEHLVT